MVEAKINQFNKLDIIAPIILYIVVCSSELEQVHWKWPND